MIHGGEMCACSKDANVYHNQIYRARILCAEVTFSSYQHQFEQTVACFSLYFKTFITKQKIFHFELTNINHFL
jgi:hypothetical protein